MTTDAQAALAAAALVMAKRVPCASPYEAEKHTLTMASGFLDWLRRPRAAPAPAQDVSMSRAWSDPIGDTPTEVIRPAAVFAMAEERTRHHATGEHVLSKTQTTPSGKYACVCGQPWPCSLRAREGSALGIDDEPTALGLDIDGLRRHIANEERGGR